MKTSFMWIAKILSIVVASTGFIATVITFLFAIIAISIQTHHGILVMSDRDRLFLLFSVGIPIGVMIIGTFGLIKTKLI